jgi:hypothetical protein
MAGRTARPREDEAVRPAAVRPAAVRPAAVRPAGWQACVSPSAARPRQPTRTVACISCSETVCSLRHPRLAAASSAQLRSVLSSRSLWHLIKQAGLDGRRTVATTQTVPTWSRAAGRPPLSIRMLTLYAHASDRSVPIGARASWQLDASSTAAELGCSLAAPRSAEQPQHSAREGSRSWNARAASPSACYARPLVGSLRRASAGQRWTDPVRAAQRTGQPAVCLSGSARPTRPLVASFRSCPARAATHTAAVARQHTEA